MALSALVLSQLPPLRVLLKPSRLVVEVHSRMSVGHFMGNANVSLVLGLTDSGGRDIRVRQIAMKLVRGERELLSMRGMSYFETPSSKASVLLIPFSLNPGESWSHSVNFVRIFERDREQWMRANISALREDLSARLAERDRDPNADKNVLVEVNPALVSPFIALFNEIFIWTPGEYSFELSVETSQKSFKSTYRFTLFESDSADLRKQTNDYKHGGGISWTHEHHGPVSVPIIEA